MANNPTANPAAPGRDLKAAFKEAGFAALVTLGLCIPIIAWGTRQNMDNVLVLDPRWDAVAWAVAIAFVGTKASVTFVKHQRHRAHGANGRQHFIQVRFR